MDLNQVMKTLEQLGTEQTKKTFLRHGAPGPLFGVKIGDLKKELLKEVKKDQQLALDLFETGNSDAQYLAGLAINPKQIEKKQLQHWANYSKWSAISEFVVAGVASESPFAVELAKEWMVSDQELLEDTGWSCYGKFLSFAPDTSINQEEVLTLLKLVENTIHQAKNSVRYTMNQFVINTGCYYKPLLKEAQQVAETIGPVQVTLGSKDCKVPLASEAIEKAIRLERIGKKRKKVIC